MLLTFRSHFWVLTLTVLKDHHAEFSTLLPTFQWSRNCSSSNVYWQELLKWLRHGKVEQPLWSPFTSTDHRKCNNVAQDVDFHAIGLVWCIHSAPPFQEFTINKYLYDIWCEGNYFQFQRRLQIGASSGQLLREYIQVITLFICMNMCGTVIQHHIYFFFKSYSDKIIGSIHQIHIVRINLVMIWKPDLLRHKMAALLEPNPPWLANKMSRSRVKLL